MMNQADEHIGLVDGDKAIETGKDMKESIKMGIVVDDVRQRRPPFVNVTPAALGLPCIHATRARAS
jgi:hypothetical protein